VAAILIRTLDDDDADAALAALDIAAREIENWRAHLRRAKIDPAPGIAMQARRSAQVVTGVVADAAACTDDVAHRAQESERQLRSVS
jgi:hypothetical protein